MRLIQAVQDNPQILIDDTKLSQAETIGELKKKSPKLSLVYIKKFGLLRPKIIEK